MLSRQPKYGKKVIRLSVKLDPKYPRHSMTYLAHTLNRQDIGWHLEISRELYLQPLETPQKSV